MQTRAPCSHSGRQDARARRPNSYAQFGLSGAPGAPRVASQSGFNVARPSGGAIFQSWPGRARPASGAQIDWAGQRRLAKWIRRAPIGAHLRCHVTLASLLPSGGRSVAKSLCARWLGRHGRRPGSGGARPRCEAPKLTSHRPDRIQFSIRALSCQWRNRARRPARRTRRTTSTRPARAAARRLSWRPFFGIWPAGAPGQAHSWRLSLSRRPL